MDNLTEKFWAIGGGKGGVGKSIITIMTGASLARQGKKVILVDADLGGSNLHTLAGIRYPLNTLAEFINREVENINDVLIDTPVENLQLICGADDVLGIANPKYTQKTRIFNALKRLEADYILLDLGAGTSFTAIDFFLYAPNKIVVLTPQATSIQNAYGFIKAAVYRKLKMTFSREPECVELIKRASAASKNDDIDSIDKLKIAFKSLDENHYTKMCTILDELNIQLILNMVRGSKENEIAKIVAKVANDYLSVDLSTLALVQYDKVLGMSVNNMEKFLREKKNTISNMCFYDIAKSIIETSRKRKDTFPVNTQENGAGQDKVNVDNSPINESPAFS